MRNTAGNSELATLVKILAGSLRIFEDLHRPAKDPSKVFDVIVKIIQGSFLRSFKIYSVLFVNPRFTINQCNTVIRIYMAVKTDNNYSTNSTSNVQARIISSLIMEIWYVRSSNRLCMLRFNFLLETYMTKQLVYL